MPRKSQSLYERWLAKVEKTDTCWLWRGAVKDTGYGVLQRGRRGEGLIRAHRFAYEHFVGPIPEGLELRHSCHVRTCVNPAHLRPGTRTENMADMVEAGRWSRREPMRGERNGNSRLTEDDVSAIKASDEVGLDLARKYRVSPATISAIRQGHTWRHV